MSEVQEMAGYGYSSDEVRQSSYNFGGNFGNTKMAKFEYINNAGKDGAEGEALDIVFNIGGSDKNYRLFPVTKVFGKNNAGELTDKNSQEYKDAFNEAMTDFNARITHILGCFVSHDAIKAGFNKKITNFKEFAQAAMAILPKDYDQKALDIFLQYQWSKSESQKQTYLEIPRTMKYGRWLSAALTGPWKEQRISDPDGKQSKALTYTNPDGETHPFERNGWFVNSNFSNVQKDAEETQAAGDAMNQANNTTSAPTSAW